MAKRNTVGRPTRQRDAEERRQLSKAERERRNQRFLIIVAGIAATFILGLLVYALLHDYLIVPTQEITTVNGVEIKTSDFQARVRAERWRLAHEVREINELTGNLQFAQSQLNQLADPQTVGSRVLDDMELEILLKDEAERRGVIVDEAAIQARVDEYMAQFTGRSLTPTPTATDTPQATATVTPLLTATASNTPTASPTASETPLPTVADCEGENCATVTPLPSATITPTPPETPETTETPTNTPLAPEEVGGTIEKYESRFYDKGDDEGKTTREALRDIFYFDALREALRTAVTDEMIANGELKTQRLWANTRHILVKAPANEAGTTWNEMQCESETWQPAYEKALQILELLNNGEPFATLAMAVSDDPGSGTEGGMLGEVNDVDSSYVAPFARAIHEGQIGAYLGPVCSEFGFHIIQILDKELRDIPKVDLDKLRQDQYTEWETGLLATAAIQRRDDWLERIPESPTLDDLLGDIINRR